jgi:hypothetical protein
MPGCVLSYTCSKARVRNAMGFAVKGRGTGYEPSRSIQPQERDTSARRLNYLKCVVFDAGGCSCQTK